MKINFEMSRLLTLFEQDFFKVQSKKIPCDIKLPNGLICAYKFIERSEYAKHKRNHIKAVLNNNGTPRSRKFEMT